MFIPTENDRFLRLDDIASFSADKRGFGSVLILRDGSEVKTSLSDLAIYRAAQPTIPAAPGFEMLSIGFEGTEDPESLKLAELIERTSVVAWRIDPGLIAPIDSSNNTFTSRDSPLDSFRAVLDPVGVVHGDDGGTYESQEVWAKAAHSDFMSQFGGKR